MLIDWLIVCFEACCFAVWLLPFLLFYVNLDQQPLQQHCFGFVHSLDMLLLLPQTKKLTSYDAK